MRNFVATTSLLAGLAASTPAFAQDVVGFDRGDFGNIVLNRKQSASAGDIEFELSVGDYNNESIRNYSEQSIFAKIGHSVGRLDILTDKGIFPCTAFIVDKKHILTNYHCVPGILNNERAGATRIDAVQFVAGYTQQGVEEGTRKFTVSPTPVEAYEDLDYALLEVLGDPSADYGMLKLAAAAPNDGDPYWVIGHPMGEAQRISREKCKANNPALSNNRLLHTCDTLPGNSGSPVIDASLQMVIGLHHAGSKRDSVNFAIPMADIIERSDILEAALSTLNDAPPSDPNPVPVDPPVDTTPTPVPDQDEAGALCDALYAEAKGYGECFAYRAYAEQCQGHKFAPFAQSFINHQCKSAEVIPPVEPTPIKPKPIEPTPVTYLRPWCSASHLTPTETAICADAYLAGLDERLEYAYNNQSGRSTSRQQATWRTSTRDACGRNAACIGSAVVDRITYLQSTVVTPPPAQTSPQVVNGNYRLSNSQCYIVTASRPSIPEAIAFANQWFSGRSGVRIFKSSNGYYGITVKTVSKSNADWQINNLKSQGAVPSDSYCSSGRLYVAEVLWQGGNAHVPTPTPAPSNRTMYVANNNDGGLNVRPGPGTNYPYFTEINVGTRLSVITTSGKWSNVILPSGQKGWVYSPLLTATQPYVRQCNARVVNLDPYSSRTRASGSGYLSMRAKPSSKGKKLSEVYLGDQVRVLAQRSGWARLECISGQCLSPYSGSAGQRGWSSTKYLSIRCN
ncbi:trypsin-like peptidase domain-containing protein [Pelagimonas varians]|uniref:Serine protease n=1 Tax=Pelagimonas varians TaxID=696760 RepID=A0A238K047_9RHOB|nr:trypsin-like peptidase domain-containing protein [Pelagimonas varians]PYG33294.1 SH3 domain-containing protein [Pelagimonas varians]SMX36260.1 Bacterial SH3 domain protein [Pelagimonas varians]